MPPWHVLGYSTAVIGTLDGKRRNLSRRKDRERLLAMKGLNPDYKGFRGYGQESTEPGNTPLEAVTCSKCGRRRNVAVGIALEQGENYVCLSCQEEAAWEAPQEEAEGKPQEGDAEAEALEEETEPEAQQEDVET